MAVTLRLPSSFCVDVRMATLPDTRQAWQKFSAWVGEMQSWAAGGVSMTRVDQKRWDPGFRKPEQKVWDIGKLKDEDYSGVDQNPPKKAWNGF